MGGKDFGKDKGGGKDFGGKDFGKKGFGKEGTSSSNYGIRYGQKRRALDLTSSVLTYVESWNVGIEGSHLNTTYLNRLAPHPSFARDLLPPHLVPHGEAYGGGAGICTRNVTTCYNKSKVAVNGVAFNPTGRRLVVGNNNGEISLWNTSQGCTFEIVQQSHTGSVRIVQYDFQNHLDEILFTGDQAGVLKLWDKNFYNNMRLIPHDGIALREIATSPGTHKFVTCADEPVVKIWDYRTLEAERKLEGHGYDVRSVDWHGSKALVATGSKDNQIKLYDPRVEHEVVTLYHHKNSISKLRFQPNGLTLASAGKDQLIHILDIRTMKLKKTLKGHNREVTCICWHPKYDNILSSGGFESSVFHWDLYGESSQRDDTGIVHPLQVTKQAHDGGCMSLDYHPLGHLLTTSGRDGTVKIWSRARPGDSSELWDSYEKWMTRKVEKGKGKKGWKGKGDTGDDTNQDGGMAQLGKATASSPKLVHASSLVTDVKLIDMEAAAQAALANAKSENSPALVPADSEGSTKSARGSGQQNKEPRESSGTAESALQPKAGAPVTASPSAASAEGSSPSTAPVNAAASSTTTSKAAAPSTVNSSPRGGPAVAASNIMTSAADKEASTRIKQGLLKSFGIFAQHAQKRRHEEIEANLPKDDPFDFSDVGSSQKKSFIDKIRASSSALSSGSGLAKRDAIMSAAGAFSVKGLDELEASFRFTRGGLKKLRM